jgi:hypothetical protein
MENVILDDSPLAEFLEGTVLCRALARPWKLTDA